jgi:hypothetical protein
LVGNACFFLGIGLQRVALGEDEVELESIACNPTITVSFGVYECKMERRILNEVLDKGESRDSSKRKRMTSMKR